MAQSHSSTSCTPAMQQFHRFKQRHPECVLFFRMGDFYELFYDDAKLAHKVLGVALTQRSEGVPMAGVPYHAVENYLRRMIQAGYRVAVCDQVEDPKLAKGVVKRDVTRIITPGTLTDETLLEEGRENPLAAVWQHRDDAVSVAWCELSTGAFNVATFPADALLDELVRIGPRELLHCEQQSGDPGPFVQEIIDTIQCPAVARPAWQFQREKATEVLYRQYQVQTLEGFGFDERDGVLRPAAAIIHYLLETQKTSDHDESARLPHLRPPRRFARSEHLIIDQISLRSLEVEHTMRSGETASSLLGILQDCRTAMGKRMLRQWLCYPLARRETIEQRQAAVAGLVENGPLLRAVRGTLDEIQDVQRIIARIAVERATPRDLVALGTSAALAKALRQHLETCDAIAHHRDRIEAVRKPLEQLANDIAAACVESPPGHLREGGLIRDGFDRQLDDDRTLQQDSSSWLADYQRQLVDQTGVGNLKVGYNKVFGFYIELTAANKDRAPTQWTRRQTLKNAERFITAELKSYEGKVLGAQQRAIAREQELFAQLCDRAQDDLHHLHEFGQAVAEIDVLSCLAQRAVRYRWVRPHIVDEPIIHVVGGRHPVLDDLLGDKFVPNDVALGAAASADNHQPAATLALITGPNMAGKSTYIRQTALIVLLAHVGSHVPADQATVGLCDRIFTRVGASDELHSGQSTFMVEMTEAANICHHATGRSLVILDEIGRGTSTLDGLALAWAITEHLATVSCRTLFATHYHELTDLSESHTNVQNLNVSVREWNDEIVFLHHIVPGATDRSYGIHVAKIAGLPSSVVKRANHLLAELQVSHDSRSSTAKTREKPVRSGGQLSLFTEYLDHPVVDQLRKVDLTQVTPLRAFDILRQLQDAASNGKSHAEDTTIAKPAGMEKRLTNKQ